MGIPKNAFGDEAQHPTGERRLSAPAHDDEIAALALSETDDLFGRMSHLHGSPHSNPTSCGLVPQLCEGLLVVFPGAPPGTKCFPRQTS